MKNLRIILAPRSRAIKRIALLLAEIPVAAALLYAGYQIVIKSVLYLAGMRGLDATLYFTVGNTLRNGFSLYRDVFDPKPPGIFLLSSVSFSLFGDGTLAYILNVIVLLAIPVLFLWWGYVYCRRLQVEDLRWGSRGVVVLQFSLMIGLALALYHATIGGEVQTEFYGAFSGLIYLAAVDVGRRKRGIMPVVIASAGFAVALLFKEPFLITLFVAALLLLRTFREWVRLFFVPLITAGVAYILVLASLGALGNYFTVYLRAMLGNYILAGGPVWARGLVAWERMYINVHDFTPWFPALLLVLFLLSLPRVTGRRGGFLGITITAACISLIAVVRSFFPLEFPWHMETTKALFLLAVSTGAVLASLRHANVLHFIRRVWRHVLALYLTLTAIGLGSGFHGQYFALALPVYAALFLLVVRKYAACHPEPFVSQDKLREENMRQAHTSVAPVLLSVTALASCILLTSHPFVPAPGALAEKLTEIRHEDSQSRAAAFALDAILNACDIDRYFFLEGALQPYAAHAPLNLYLFTRIEHITRYHPLFFDETFRRLGQAQVIIEARPYVSAARKGNLEEECVGNGVRTFVNEKFTAAPWACAKDLPVPEGYSVLFRNNPDDQAEPDVLQCRTL